MPTASGRRAGSHQNRQLVVFAVATLVVAVPVVCRAWFADAPEIVGVASVCYAVGAVSVWASTTALTGELPSGMLRRPVSSVGIGLLGNSLLTVQAAVPVYGYVHWGLATPLVGLFAATSVTLFTFSANSPESDALDFYALVFGPILLGGTGVLALFEYGTRTLVGG